MQNNEYNLPKVDEESSSSTFSESSSFSDYSISDDKSNVCPYKQLYVMRNGPMITVTPPPKPIAPIKPAALIKNADHLINAVNNLLSMDVVNRYQQLKLQNSIMLRLKKSLGKSLNHKREIRHEMLANLTTLMARLRDLEISPIKKVLILEDYLNSMQTSIRHENNRYDSDLNRLCEQLKTINTNLKALFKKSNQIVFAIESRFSTTPAQFARDLLDNDADVFKLKMSKP